jgi:hypothetical protein
MRRGSGRVLRAHRTFFLFMVGMSRPIALGRRTDPEAAHRQNLRHVLMRCPRQTVPSQTLISIESDSLHFQMRKLLTCSSVAYFLCFPIMQLFL